MSDSKEKSRKSEIQKASDLTYKAGRILRDVNAIDQAIKKRSWKPIVKRILRKIIGRKIVSKLFKF